MNKSFALSLLFLTVGYSASVFADDNLDQLIARGRYVATAADCAACHTASPAGKDLAGGYAIESPMGSIISTNITPSKDFGIGNWSEKEFNRAVREGVAPQGNLYPAMPYTAYSEISDQDMHALWIYFSRGVKAVDEAPAEKTNLVFPFNFRMLMKGWNLLYSGPQAADAGKVSPGSAGRGEYLVNALEHCSTCHTPRNMMMAEKQSGYLSGAAVGGWFAPNITSDPVAGIGSWSKQDIVDYLRTGRVIGKAQAAGPMAEAVEHSLRHLSDDDLQAIADYLKTVKPVNSTHITNVVYGQSQPKPEEFTKLDYDISHDPHDMADGSSLDGTRLYVSACASCHQLSGQGTADQFYPSLTSNTAVGNPNHANLIMAILQGVKRQTNDYDVGMPAFHDQLSDAQVASVANYVIDRFGGGNGKVTVEEVALLKAGGAKPFIVTYMNWMIAGGVIFGLFIILLLMYFLRKRKHTQ